jgi:hypothetical protein
MPEEKEDESMVEKRPSALKGSRVERDPLMGSPVAVHPNKQARIDEVPAWVGGVGGGSAGGKDGVVVAAGSAERAGPEVVAAGSGENGVASVEDAGKIGGQASGSIPGSGPAPQALPGQVPFFPGQGPPGFETGSYGPNWGKGGGQGFPYGYSQNFGSMPYPQVPNGPSISDLMDEVRAGNLNVNSKFQILQNQLSAFQVELAAIKTEMVTNTRFEEWQTRIVKLETEIAGTGAGTDSKAVQALTLQLDRLDPAKKCLAIHGLIEINLTLRSQLLNGFVGASEGCPLPIGIDHIQKGRAGERVPTKVSLIEFRSNSDREKAFNLLKDRDLKNADGSKLTCKRARTSFQKQRNDELITAEKLLKEKHESPSDVKINWQERSVDIKEVAAFLQNRNSTTGKFTDPFLALNK